MNKEELYFILDECDDTKLRKALQDTWLYDSLDGAISAQKRFEVAEGITENPRYYKVTVEEIKQ
jgi:hypothetical protein